MTDAVDIPGADIDCTLAVTEAGVAADIASMYADVFVYVRCNGAAVNSYSILLGDIAISDTNKLNFTISKADTKKFATGAKITGQIRGVLIGGKVKKSKPFTLFIAGENYGD